MADFGAVVMDEPPLKHAYTGGGTIAASGLTVPPLKHAYTGGGTVSAVKLTVPTIKRGAQAGGTVSASLRTVPSVVALANPSGGTAFATLISFGDALFVNRVFDSVANKFITWPSIQPDPTGRRYPGPGQFGVTTSDYVLLSS